MAEAKHAKLDIAREYLELAMNCFADKRDYFCAIHLAEAALELADMQLPKAKRTYIIQKKAEVELRREYDPEPDPQKLDKKAHDYIAKVKNGIKHGTGTVVVDPVFTARWSIEAALRSFDKLGPPIKTQAYWRFTDLLNAEMPERLGLKQGIVDRVS